jgi:hypothetical protein
MSGEETARVWPRAGSGARPCGRYQRLVHVQCHGIGALNVAEVNLILSGKHRFLPAMRNSIFDLRLEPGYRW